MAEKYQVRRILLGFKSQVDKELKQDKPSVTILNKQNRICSTIDVAWSFNTMVPDKEKDVIERLNDLKWELRRI